MGCRVLSWFLFTIPLLGFAFSAKARKLASDPDALVVVAAGLVLWSTPAVVRAVMRARGFVPLVLPRAEALLPKLDFFLWCCAILFVWPRLLYPMGLLAVVVVPLLVFAAAIVFLLRTVVDLIATARLSQGSSGRLLFGGDDVGRDLPIRVRRSGLDVVVRMKGRARRLQVRARDVGRLDRLLERVHGVGRGGASA